jgi:hypothetical protein
MVTNPGGQVGKQTPSSLRLAVPTAQFGGTPDVSIPHQSQDDEAAIHALVAAPEGWLAVGNLTQMTSVGTAAVWRVGRDGTFGNPELLPGLDPGTPSIARDALVRSDGSAVVVGGTGAGRDSVATAWIGSSDGRWTPIALQTETGRVQGTVVDSVLALAGGELVAVGRGDGPSYPTLVLWWSQDNWR